MRPTSLPPGQIAPSAFHAFSSAYTLQHIRAQFVRAYGRDRGLWEHAKERGAKRAALACRIRELSANMRRVGVRPGEARRAVLAQCAPNA